MGVPLEQLGAGVLRAHRWQYIVSGTEHPRFAKILGGLITREHERLIATALTPLIG